MRNFWIVLKVSMLNNLKLNKLRKKFAKNRFLQIVSPIIVALLVLIVIATIGFYLYIVFSMFVIAEEYYGMLLFGLTIGALFSFFTTITTANSYLFSSKDYDLLMSLPIKPRSIIASKFSGLLLINYLFFAIIFVPSIVVYGIYVSPGIIFYLLSVIVLLVGPLLIITIASTILYLLNLVLSKLKYRNLIQIIAVMIIFFAFMYFYFRSMTSFSSTPSGQNELEGIKGFVQGMINLFEKIYYPGRWAAIGLEGDYLSLLFYLLISILPFILFIYFVGHNFAQTVARFNVTYTNKNYQLTEQKARGQISALLKREFKMFFTNSGIVLNIMTGPIMGTVFLVVYYINSSGMPIVIEGSMMVIIALGITLFMSSIMPTTTNSISLEGKTLWIIRSSPVEETTIFKAKILFNFLLVLPFLLINSILVAILFEITIFDIIMFLLISAVFSIFDGSFCLFINLCFPKLDWDNPVRVIKQSLSTFICMFGGMIILGLIIFLAFKLVSLGHVLMLSLVLLLLIILLGVSIIVLKTNGVKKFNRLKV